MGCITSRSSYSENNVKTNLKVNETNSLQNLDQNEFLNSDKYKKFVALYDLQTKTHSELSFKQGDIIYVIEEANTDWWKAVHSQTKEHGFVPNNYLKPFSENPDVFDHEELEWYHPNLTRQEAEQQLIVLGELHGTFLVRSSENPRTPHTLSILDHNRVVRHYRISLYPGEGYGIDANNVYTNLRDLIEFYKSGKDASLCKLTTPIIREPPSIPGLGKDTWEIHQKQIQLLKKIGSGAHGDVWVGRFEQKKIVAIKTFKQQAMTPEDFLAEANIMKKIKHKRLTELLGVCSVGKPLMIIVEYMEGGSLQDYLRQRPNILSLAILITMCIHICEGMEYLESIQMIHRDLAARNVLLSKTLACKIADFGMSKLVKNKEISEENELKLPIKWTAPEAVINKTFSSKTDVWSFGVVMWEIFSYCQMPYGNLNNKQVLNFVHQGNRLQKPQICPDSIYNILSICWLEDGAKRPTFSQLLKHLISEEKILEKSGVLYSEI